MPKDTRALFDDRITITEVGRRIMDFHRPIQHLFYADVGMSVFFDESEILIDALLGLQERGITGLPIHDAIIVPHGHRETAELVMAGAFRAYTGVDAQVSVD